MITSDQVRMARAALKIGVRDLASLAGVTPPTISRFETGKASINSGTMKKMINALEDAGIEFIDEGKASPSGGAGVRFKQDGDG